MNIIKRMLEWLGWRPRGRQIFRFHDGRRKRFIDPIMASLLLAEHEQYLPSHLAEARAGDIGAIAICVDAARIAFDAHDLTKVECVKLLFAFDLWVHSIKRKHRAFSRLVAMHGCDIGSLDPERFVALYFSRAENEVRIAEPRRTAIRAANAELPLGWFTATRDTFDEAVRDHSIHIAAIASAQSQRNL